MLKIKLIRLVVLGGCMLFTSALQAEQYGELAYTGEHIQLHTENRQTFAAYIAGPRQAKQGLLLIHGWWGLNKDVEVWANQFAMAGYYVLAVDIFNGNVTTDPSRARQLISDLNQAKTNQKYVAALNYLTASNRKVAIIGRSFGATQAIHAAAVAPDKVSATVIYYPYGEPPMEKELLTSIKAPILAHFAKDDHFFPPNKRAEFIEAIKQTGLYLTTELYEARHGFDNPGGKNFSEPVHKLSLDRTYQFVNQHTLNIADIR